MAPVNGILVGISAVIFVGIAIAQAYQFATELAYQGTQQQKQAWHWWYTQQQQQQHDHAESVRDGLLQETFALRRSLEQGQLDLAISPLDQVNQVYQALEALSNELSPPFVEDSLPLALQFLLQRHGQTAEFINLAPGLDWSADQGIDNTVVVSVVEQLVPLFLQGIQSPLQGQLNRQDAMNTLQLTGKSLNQQAMGLVLAAPEIAYLKEIFQSLLSGTLEINQWDNRLICQLSWNIVSDTTDSID